MLPKSQFVNSCTASGSKYPSALQPAVIERRKMRQLAFVLVVLAAAGFHRQLTSQPIDWAGVQPGFEVLKFDLVTGFRPTRAAHG